MSEEERYANKRSTGTVPKQRNNYSRTFTEVERLRSLSNSSSDCYPSRDSSKEIKNPRRSNQVKDLIVESTLEDQNFSSPQISYVTLNSIGSSNPSSPLSRRNSSSSTLKCDNITKCPNKKQIEDKLNQIHEYLKVTNSLMESMKKPDEQIQSRADEYSVEGPFSCRKNGENANMDNIGYNLGIVKECQQEGYPLRRKSENKRGSSSQNQSNLLLEVGNGVHNPLNRDTRNFIEFDTVSKERTEKLKKTSHPKTVFNPDKSFTNIDSLHNQIMSMHNSHDEGELLLETLDGTDSELAIQHAELHKKLTELQSRKFQIDRLVAQLHSFGDTYEDTDNQCKKIYAMKEQLGKLKDMLEVVKIPDILQNTNNSYDDRKMSCYLCSSLEQSREKDVKNPKLHSRIHNDSNMFVNGKITAHDTRPKQLNNRDRGNQMNKANMSSIAQKIALQTELECKKRELVEFMGKHKGNASNLNQDVGIDTKSDISSIANGLNEPWASIISQESDSEWFSSDDCQDEVNNFQEVKHNFLSLPSLNYSPSSITNCQSENSHRNYGQSSEYQPLNGPTQAPELHFRSNSVGATTSRSNRPSRSNEQDSNSNKVQKQLQMIRSMCDSMLEQQVGQEHPSNTQQLRNNLILSPQRHSSPHPQRSNPNAAIPNSDVPPQWFPPNVCNNLNNDMASYYNWLSNNTIQTQSFMLNTLNQCYQMLWMQQRELATVKSNVSVLQERLKNCNTASGDNYSPPSLQTNSQLSPNRPVHQTDHKLDQHSGGGFTIPLPEQFDCPLPNISLNCLNNNNSLNAQHNPTEPNLSTSIGHHIWSGQALNNQVVPGNRANNYWDNFRSYSRQNLLSSKNNEVLQNLPTVNPFAFISFSKSNSEQDSTSTSQENTPQGMVVKETGVLPSDILNINNPMRNLQATESPSKDVVHKDDADIYFGLPIHLNSNNDVSVQHSNLSGSHIHPESKRRNERMENVTEASQISKSAFEEMRENVYKEVATLISANENRPEFLIQLFRDLQMIKSDNGRFNILQSIERNVTRSRVSTQNDNKQTIKCRNFSSQSVPSLDINTSSNSSSINEYTTYSNIFQEIQLFLEHHEEIIIQNQFVTALKRFLFGLESFKEVAKDVIFRNHLNQSLNTELEKYFGKRLSEVKMQLLETTNCLVYEHLGMIRFTEDVNNVCTSTNTNQDILNSITANKELVEDRDLAEADQSGITNEDNAEEGAVGGILDTTICDATEVLVNQSVPSQLPNQDVFRSTTPTKDEASSTSTSR